MFESLLKKTARALDKAGIDYMVIGGQAVLLYGEPRLTKDIDITLCIGPERLDELLKIIKDNDLKILADDIQNFARSTFVVPVLDEKTSIRIDFILSNSSYEQEALQNAKRVLFGKTAVKFASLEDLVIHKLIASRPRDIEDVRAILRKDHRYDRGYILRWLGEFDKSLATDSVAIFLGIAGKV